jgi:multiple sugar transport system substrate-binding protein
MKLKKVLAVALVATMTLSLAACGSKSSDSSDSGSTASSGDSDVTLTVAIWDSNQEPGLKEIMDDFTAETGVKVDIQVTPWSEYWTMLEAATQGGDMPDVFWMHSDQIATYAAYDDILLDLSDKIAESDKIDLDNYPENLVTLYQNDDGDQLAIPKDIDTCAVWYNKTMFDAAGIDYPTADWTWEDFREIAKELTDADNNQYGVAIKPSSYQESWYSTIYAYGGEVISEDKTKSGFDDPNTIEAMQLIENIIKDGSMPDYSVVAENNTEDLMMAGTVAMTFQGSWMIADLTSNEYVQENCDIAPLPQGPYGTKSISNGLGWAASAQGDHTEEAWELIEYLGSKEAQQKQAELGVTMSAYEGVSDAWVNSHPEFNMQAYIDMLDDAQAYPSSKNTQVWYQVLMERMVDAFSGAKPMDEVCKDFAVEMNQFLAEEQ